MKICLAALILLSSIGALLADSTLENVQQALKDEGFYYGEITGNKDADTTAAIRRYQIRNGLQITGDLNDETLKSLGVNSSGGRTVVKASPTAAPGASDSRALLKQEPEPEQTQGPTNPLTGQPFPQPKQGPQSPSAADDDVAPPRAGAGNFVGTPYETAPPEVQRNVVVSAETFLARRGLYRGPIDGFLGPDLEFSLRAYQARARLPVTGRLDLETLAALQLLPGANAPIYVPRRRPLRESPVRGEWIHER